MVNFITITVNNYENHVNHYYQLYLFIFINTCV